MLPVLTRSGYYCYSAAGELPLPVVRLFSRLRCRCISEDSEDGSFYGSEDESDEEDDAELYLEKAGPGFTLPANIGDLDPAVTVLDLSYCNLTGLYFVLNDD